MPSLSACRCAFPRSSSQAHAVEGTGAPRINGPLARVGGRLGDGPHPFLARGVFSGEGRQVQSTGTIAVKGQHIFSTEGVGREVEMTVAVSSQ